MLVVVCCAVCLLATVTCLFVEVSGSQLQRAQLLCQEPACQGTGMAPQCTSMQCMSQAAQFRQRTGLAPDQQCAVHFIGSHLCARGLHAREQAWHFIAARCNALHWELRSYLGLHSSHGTSPAVCNAVTKCCIAQRVSSRPTPNLCVCGEASHLSGAGLAAAMLGWDFLG